MTFMDDSTHVAQWLHVKLNNEIMLEIFQCFSSCVTRFETETKLFQLLKEF